MSLSSTAMRKQWLVLLLGVSLLILSPRTQAQVPVSIPETESYAFDVPSLGHSLEVRVALPRGYNDSQVAYPVIYLLDANLMFGTVTESVRSMNISGAIRPAMVVGIGYDSGRFWNTMAARALDLTPTEDLAWENEQRTRYPDFPTPDGSGGAPRLLDFVVDRVIPFVEERYRASPDERFLVGHSFSGLFVLYTLFTRPEVFVGYLASSPSLWWDDDVLFEDASAYVNRATRPPATLFMSVGEDELPEFSMVSNAARMADLLRNEGLGELRLEFRLIDGSGHNASIPIAMSYGLRALLPP